MGHVPNEEDKVKLIYSAIVIITLLLLIGSEIGELRENVKYAMLS